LIKIIESIRDRRATIAMLCKTAVARKVLAHAWKTGIGLEDSAIHTIDAAADFRASVSASLLVCNASPTACSSECRVYTGLEEGAPSGAMGFRDGALVADLDRYETWKHLQGDGDPRWRSGIKHDCSAVMELTGGAGNYRNGLGEVVRIEDDSVYPMLKGSDIARGTAREPGRWMLVPQRFLGEDTSQLGP